MPPVQEDVQQRTGQDHQERQILQGVVRVAGQQVGNPSQDQREPYRPAYRSRAAAAPARPRITMFMIGFKHGLSFRIPGRR